MMREEILEQLFAARDEKYKKFSDGLIPGAEREESAIGVRLPKLRLIAKDVAKQDPEEYAEELPKDCFWEERFIQGAAAGYAKLDFDTWKSQIAEFVPYICDWSMCDSVAATQKIVRKHMAEGWEFLRPYVGSSDEFTARFGVVMLLDHFVDKTYVDRVLDVLAGVKNRAYYVTMAVAWNLSVCYVRFPEKTEVLFESGRLDDVTQNRAIQKIRESYRVSDEDKDRLRGLKRHGCR